MRDALYIAGKDVRYMLREKATLLWLFVMPIVFFYFIGTITSGFGGGDAANGRRIALAMGADTGPLAAHLEHRLGEGGDVVAVPADSVGAFRPVLWVPSGFSDSLRAGATAELEYALDEEGFFSGERDRFRIARAAYGFLADWIVAERAGGRDVPVDSLTALAVAPRSIRVERLSAGHRQDIPTGFQQAVPGNMVMFTLLIMTTSGAILLVVERRQGLLRRLAATPISRSNVLAGKWLGKLALGLIQILFAMVAGTLLFDFDWGPNLPAVGAVMLSYGALMASIGMLFGSAVRTEAQATAIGVISSNVLAALGGCWWPIEVTPAWMQGMQNFLPTGWAMDALHALVTFGHPPVSVLSNVAVMWVATLIVLSLTRKVFRYE